MFPTFVFVTCGITAGCTPAGPDSGSILLVPEVHGVLLENGHPVAGAAIDRDFLWHWKNQTGEDETSTNSQGEFNFAAVMRRSFWSRAIPMRPPTDMAMVARVAGRSVPIWDATKRDYADLPGQGIDAPIHLVCTLDAPLRDVSGVSGRCSMR